MDAELATSKECSDSSCSRPPQSKAEEELNTSLKRLKMDMLGFIHFGGDGVMRSINADRKVVDAFGLTPEQVKIWLERMPNKVREVFNQEAYRLPDGTFPDGMSVSKEDMYRSDNLSLIPPIPKEEQARQRAEHFENGLLEKLKERGMREVENGLWVRNETQEQIEKREKVEDVKGE